MSFTLKHLASLVQVAIQHRASDIHIRSNEMPVLRIKGDLVPVQTKDFSIDDVADIMGILTNNSQFKNDLSKHNEIDGAFTIPEMCRVRFNFFKYSDHYGIILRIINDKIPTLKDLAMPPILGQIALQNRGLILITGATGSGKSTTLAAMINHINENKAAHILTIEDPIEYVHKQQRSRITQREVGIDTDSYTLALRSALRQDPDVILIGEMRDPETVSIALKAAETGHVVFSTMHTTNVLTTIGRMISMFPATEQIEIRKRMAENLHAVVGQRMLPGKNTNIVIAQEIMVTNPGVKEAIQGKEDISRIHSIMANGFQKGGNGGQTFDQHIMRLYQEKIISKETALEAVSSQADFIQKLIVE
jgi:twitching motility protein PilT